MKALNELIELKTQAEQKSLTLTSVELIGLLLLDRLDLIDESLGGVIESLDAVTHTIDTLEVNP